MPRSGRVSSGLCLLLEAISGSLGKCCELVDLACLRITQWCYQSVRAPLVGLRTDGIAGGAAFRSISACCVPSLGRRIMSSHWHAIVPVGRAFRRQWRDNISMRQLQFFTTAELAKMRDRTRKRNYSPAGEEFRREHERHRAWGLQQRHAAKLSQLRRAAVASATPATSPTPTVPAAPAAHKQPETREPSAKSHEPSPSSTVTQPVEASPSQQESPTLPQPRPTSSTLTGTKAAASASSPGAAGTSAFSTRLLPATRPRTECHPIHQRHRKLGNETAATHRDRRRSPGATTRPAWLLARPSTRVSVAALCRATTGRAWLPDSAIYAPVSGRIHPGHDGAGLAPLGHLRACRRRHFAGPRRGGLGCQARPSTPPSAAPLCWASTATAWHRSAIYAPVGGGTLLGHDGEGSATGSAITPPSAAASTWATTGRARTEPRPQHPHHQPQDSETSVTAV